MPAYASLALFVDADAFDCTLDPLDEAAVAGCAQQAFDGDDAGIAGRSVEIPVRYGGEYGPDLDAVAAHAGLGERRRDRAPCRGRIPRGDARLRARAFRTCSASIRRLAMPRLETPRTRVPAGSVGIGGAQTGIYPRTGPGGWRIIGRTTLALFDPLHDPPTLLAPGDRVRFVPVAAMSDHACSHRALLTTVQDGGRDGYRHLGVGSAGAMDA